MLNFSTNKSDVDDKKFVSFKCFNHICSRGVHWMIFQCYLYSVNSKVPPAFCDDEVQRTQKVCNLSMCIVAITICEVLSSFWQDVNPT